MVRMPMTEGERDRGKALGAVLRAARASRSAAEVAQVAGISIDTLRKIERGAIASPAFFTVVALARVLDLDLDDLAARLALGDEPVGADRADADTAHAPLASGSPAASELRFAG